MLDKSLRIALLISTSLHILLFAPFWYLRQVDRRKYIPAIEVTYLIVQAPEPEPTPPQTITQALPQPQESPSPKENSTEKEIPVEKEPAPPETAAKIEIPPELPKEKEAVYLTYYQSIREKIRLLVLKNYPRFIAQGEVCLYFVLDAKGNLKELKVVPERSSPHRLLKQIARKSVEEAQPFLPFPEDLNQRQLSFNVIISFELEK